MKTLYIDTETTGTDPQVNDIIQIAFIIETDNKINGKWDFKCSPLKQKNISQEALDIQGLTFQDVINRPPPSIAYKELIKVFDRYINKFDKADKFTVIGHNVKFDISFLQQFFISNGNHFLYSYINYFPIDTLFLANYLKYHNILNTDNLKLATLCDYFKISLDAHDAMNDIIATRDLLIKMNNLIDLKYDT